MATVFGLHPALTEDPSSLWKRKWESAQPIYWFAQFRIFAGRFPELVSRVGLSLPGPLPPQSERGEQLE
jgi:hypothetical protein